MTNNETEVWLYWQISRLYSCTNPAVLQVLTLVFDRTKSHGTNRLPTSNSLVQHAKHMMDAFKSRE